MNRFSLNGDGKGNAPIGRALPHPSKPSNEHERQVIEDLKGRFDQIETLWKEAEEDLKQFRIPYAVRHCYEQDAPYWVEGSTTPIVCMYYLSWKRYGKSWRICHEVCEAPHGDEEHGSWETTPITDCTLALRMRMIANFELLRKKVIETAEKTVPKLDEAIASFQKVLKR